MSQYLVFSRPWLC